MSKKSRYSSRYQSLLTDSQHQRAQRYFKSKNAYEEELESLQRQLLEQQQHLHRQGKKVILIFEGPDAAGKGGTIKRLTEKLDPRGVRVHAIAQPDALEAEQHYLQRFFTRLPSPGTLCIFDRSWYGRVLVERVEKLCPESAWRRAYAEINTVEKMLIDDEVLVLKYFLDLTHDEQKRRFEERRRDPLKSWKLTPDDHRNRNQWPSYYKAYTEMLKKTHTPQAPWAVVSADSKWYCRIAIYRDIVKRTQRFRNKTP